jgi:sterol desaturase/sphingolipid hydroxylase (fatty acid hydroxylase superfamily)
MFLRYTRECLDVAEKWPPPRDRPSQSSGKAGASIPVFEERWFERFFARAHPLTPIVWFAPIVAFALFDAVKAGRRVELVTLPLVLGGWLTWSLAEYALHRFVFHMAAHTPRERLRAFLMHGYHHVYPSDRMRLVAPPLMSWPLACVVAVVIRQALGPAHWLPFFAGIVLGYLAYDYVHYYTHHFRPRRGMGKWLRSYHMLHHHDDRGSRFGVSSPLWDIVFRTYEPVRSTRAMTNHQKVDTAVDTAMHGAEGGHRRS